MSSKYASRSNPLAGRSNTPEPAQQPAQSHTQQAEPSDHPDFWNPHSKANIMARKASAEIRRKYRIESGDVARLAKHDHEMKQIWNELMDGTYEPPASVISQQERQENPLRDPRNWSRPR